MRSVSREVDVIDLTDECVNPGLYIRTIESPVKEGNSSVPRKRRNDGSLSNTTISPLPLPILRGRVRKSTTNGVGPTEKLVTDHLVAIPSEHVEKSLPWDFESWVSLNLADSLRTDNDFNIGHGHGVVTTGDKDHSSAVPGGVRHPSEFSELESDSTTKHLGDDGKNESRKFGVLSAGASTFYSDPKINDITRPRPSPKFWPQTRTSAQLENGPLTSTRDTHQEVISKQRTHPSAYTTQPANKRGLVSKRWDSASRKVTMSTALRNQAEFVISELAGEKTLSAKLKSRGNYLARKVSSPNYGSPLYLPYLSFRERDLIRRLYDNAVWVENNSFSSDGLLLHADFSEEECDGLVETIAEKLRIQDQKGMSAPTFINTFLGYSDYSDIQSIAKRASRNPRVGGRTFRDIETFIDDTLRNSGARSTSLLCFGCRNPKKSKDHRPTSAQLRNRELGIAPASISKQDHCSISLPFRNAIAETFGPYASFQGTSGDVGTVAWSPREELFAAGSVCLVDPDNMQYNRPNNLLLGDMGRKTLRELPHHATDRQRPTTGTNSSLSMHISQDPRLFMTVQNVQFSTDGCYMYSAGHDQYLRTWDLRNAANSIPAHTSYLHNGPVDIISVADHGAVATGCQSVAFDSIHIFQNTDGKLQSRCAFQSRRARERSADNILPSCIRWGIHPQTREYILAGFSSNLMEIGKETTGEICLWDVRTQQPLSIINCVGSIFDCAWNPNLIQSPLFAVGSVVNTWVNRNVYSVVRMYDFRTPRYSLSMELECAARDMNDVVYCPYDDKFVSAACTDGSTYIWDTRNPNEILHKLEHEAPLLELDVSLPRELTDTGVRFCSWGDNRTRLYTGSSDGVLKSWDVYQNSDDTFVRDVVRLESGVMAGAFSPDYSSLLLGEISGTIDIVQAGYSDCTIREADCFTLIKADNVAPPTVLATVQGGDADEEESGIASARALVRSGCIDLRPLGTFPVRQAVQGDYYGTEGGPIDRAPDSWILRDHATQFQSDQRILAASPPCQIPACVSSKAVADDTTDSGRSADRIPSSLLRNMKSSTNGKGAFGASRKCTICGSPARPGDDENLTFCEACHFSCFRCGGGITVDADVDVIECGPCKLTWTMDALGYTLQRAATGALPAASHLRADQPPTQAGSDGNDEEAVGNTSLHYHSLWGS